MLMRAISVTIAVVLVSSLALPRAQAWDPVPPQPLTKTISYGIHEDPNDPNSAVVFTITLDLRAEARAGDSIGWGVTQIEFVEPGQGGGDDTLWIDSDPSVPSSDGRWWIDHADWTDPQLEEFAEPPHLVGTAPAEDPYDADLEYDFEGDDYTGQGPWNPTGYLDYWFKLDGASEAFLSTADDEPEPVTVDDEDEEPTSGG
jgi:hypothetical protein